MRIDINNPLTKMGIKQQLIVLFLLMAGPILFLNMYGNLKAVQILKKHVTSAYVELSKQNLNLISRDIDSVDRIMTTVIQNPVTQQIVPSEEEGMSVYDLVKKYTVVDNLLSFYSTSSDSGESISYSLYIYDPDDNYFFAPKIPLTQRGVYFFSDANKPAWFDEAVSKRGKGYLRIIDQAGIKPGQKTLAYIRAVYDTKTGNSVIGVLVASNMNDQIQKSIQTVELPDGEIYFTDWDDTILTSNIGGIGNRLWLPDQLQRSAKHSGTDNVITDSYIFVANYNAAPQQKLVYKIPVRSLLQQQSELRKVLQLMTLTYGLFAFLLMMYFWRSLLTPLQKLANFVRSYVPGEVIPQAPGKSRNDEIGVLMLAIYDMADRLNLLVRDKYQLDIKQKESQLQLLYEQINPHLLYNTLESIYWKSSLEGNSESAEMIKDLSKLMRISLSKGRELITLQEELEHASAYVKLQQSRYEYGFQIRWHIPEEALAVTVPKITLQPLIENAIIHGVKHMGDEGEIAVSARIEGDLMFLEVSDNGYKGADLAKLAQLLDDAEADPSLGYGVRNIHKRFQLHYGPQYGLAYSRNEQGGTTATVTVPLVPRSAEVTEEE
ncbi:cache domain-containing sensor histidine kinase [Paenibacillus protaetiae]|uniref:histidine kinase n=1 Tax=Paenibacillus protaetiae TaxID=2509456 RepID=A0A4P6F059_9BACL|nr:sensor histidine kinase [Paenibacillus protaetiae]QAY67973.1 sensor histidine kinase [Paenibacillus protaetiae]